MCVRKIGSAWIPLLTFGLFAACMVVSYLVSHFKGYNRSLIPFISDTGGIPPASCWFALLLNASAYLFLLCAYIRYGNIRDEVGHSRKLVKILNILGFLVAFCSAMGMSVVGCFPVTQVLQPHNWGAFVAFVGACLYASLQTCLTYPLISTTANTKVACQFKLLFALRVVLTLLCWTFLCSHVGTMMKNGGFSMLYEPTDDTRALYYACTISQRLLAFWLALFISTFAYEFTGFQLLVKAAFQHEVLE